MPTFTYQGITVHYTETGLGRVGPLVVLIHSGSNSAAQWDGVAAQLGERHRVLAPDLYNCGGTSPWPGPGPLTFDAETQLVRALIARAGGSAHLVGHSFGGGVALRIAALAREALLSLTLIEPPGYPLLRDAGHEEAYADYAGVRDAFLAAVGRGDHAAAWQGFIDHYHGRGDAWAGLSERVRAKLVARSPTQIGVYQAQDSNPTTLADIARLGEETLLLQGEHAAIAERSFCALITATAPACRSIIIAGAGHMSPISHAQEVAEAIDAHISARQL
ncbi:MAG TPA: alpha/beta fold hydrolase [Alphaproteobacteria bacterium]|nr:alpha/beta fold hydrolase [Alphaproteobacteria bacterium]